MTDLEGWPGLSFAGNVVFVSLAAACSAMAYHHDSRRIFVGQDNGAVMVGGFQSVFVMLPSACSLLLGSLSKVNSEWLMGIKDVAFSTLKNGLILISASF